MNFRRKTDDLTGKVFGKRTVIRRTRRPRNAKGNHSYWLTRCECGDVQTTAAYALKRSLGCKACAMVPYRKKAGESSFNGLYLSYKHNALAKNRKFTLTKKQFRSLTQDNCVYCGVEPSKVHKAKTGYGEYIYNGVDRVDSDKGYITGNVVTCCEMCNRAKNAYSLQKFQQWILRLVEFNKEKI